MISFVNLMEVFIYLSTHVNLLPDLFGELQRNLFSSNPETVQRMYKLAEREVIMLFWFLTIIEISLPLRSVLVEEIGNMVFELLAIYQRLYHRYAERENWFKIQQVSDVEVLVSHVHVPICSNDINSIYCILKLSKTWLDLQDFCFALILKFYKADMTKQLILHQMIYCTVQK